VAAISHEQAEQVAGGMSKVHQLFVENFVEQRLDQGVWITPTTKISLELALFVADQDAQRAALAAKGSAGLKCCAFCQNCLAKNAAGAAVDAQKGHQKKKNYKGHQVKKQKQPYKGRQRKQNPI
jgi:hypothetical protein